jgi:hypothetical protein
MSLSSFDTRPPRAARGEGARLRRASARTLVPAGAAVTLAGALAACASHQVATDGGALDGALDGGRPDLGRPDGAPLDGPTCRPAVLDGAPELICPARIRAGEPAFVQVRSWHSGCCSSGELRATPLALDSSTVQLVLEGTVCDCCDECTCLGPRLEATVRLEAPPVGTVDVIAGSSRCTILVEPAGACRPLRVDELRAPRVRLPGQSFGFVARGDSGSCGCSPRLDEAGPGDFRVELCGCCDACDCVDPPVEVAHLGEWPRDTLKVNEATVDLTVGGECRDPAPDMAYTVAAPSWAARRVGPALWMLHAVGTSPYAECCGPRSAVEVTRAGPREFRASLRDCTPPCRCAGPPGRLEAWAPLGELAPGRYSVRLPGGRELSFDAFPPD